MAAADIVFANFAQAKLAVAPTGTGGLSFSVAAGKGALFPVPGGSQYFYGIFINAAKTVFEIVKITARATDAFTIGAAGRALDGTTAQTWTANDFFYYGMTAIMLSEFFSHVSQVTGAHAASAIGNTPAGNIAATDVQAAINELDAEKLGLSTGGTITGPLNVSGGGNVWSTGDAKLTLKAAADTGWVMANDGTIGDATSGATTRANVDTSALYTLLWTNCVDADCPVSTGRGGSAAADFAAHKTIRLPLALGRALALSGAGAGLTARALGNALGEEAHSLSTPELAAHNHGVNDPGHNHSSTIFQSAVSAAGATPANLWNQTTATVTGTSSTGITTQNAGNGTAHNNMQPTTFLNVMIKL